MAIVTVDFDGTLYRGNSMKTMIQVGKATFTPRQWIGVVTGLGKAVAIGAVKGKDRFRHEFFRSFARAFKGKSTHELDEFFQILVDHGKEDVHHSLIHTVRQHEAKGDTVIILSGALQPFLRAFVKEWEINAHVLSTELLFSSSGDCTGELGDIINGDLKVKALLQWIEEQNLQITEDEHEIWAYADSASDIPLLQYVTHPIVVNPREDMMKIAEENQWSIFA
ncbi:haloacid dehalogenase [Bacillus coahuilensis p1.1.43]|uniref:Haloacid dehalogenase n=1 Tax=Bacillus coahuilensis p1.1.43 TaxID=1150625 RepID=A0A147KCB6_9BACI|nr:HAD family hydrolase [Bacillus coahuilensis]KUP09258.1 haloacid dehalogenase [Bacillus coahuilensis p1.1.43]